MSNAANRSNGYLRYVPLDALLAMPSVRVLRHLRHFDDRSIREIAEALNESDARPIWNALGDHVACGRAERFHVPGGYGGMVARYRATAAGKAWLASMLKRSDIEQHRRIA